MMSMSKLKGMKMPSPKSDPEMDMSDLQDEGEMEASEDSEEAMPQEASPLADIADEDLLAEVRKRGLKLEDAEMSSEPSDEEKYV